MQYVKKYIVEYFRSALQDVANTIASKFNLYLILASCD